MIKKEFYKTRNDGIKLFKTYSDQHLKIKQVETNIIFEEAIDVENAPYSYEETDKKIENEVIDEKILEELWEEESLNGLK